MFHSSGSQTKNNRRNPEYIMIARYMPYALNLMEKIRKQRSHYLFPSFSLETQLCLEVSAFRKTNLKEIYFFGIWVVSNAHVRFSSCSYLKVDIPAVVIFDRALRRLSDNGFTKDRVKVLRVKWQGKTAAGIAVAIAEDVLNLITEPSELAPTAAEVYCRIDPVGWIDVIWLNKI